MGVFSRTGVGGFYNTFFTKGFGGNDEAPLFEDTNLESIDINQKYSQGKVTFELKRLENAAHVEVSENGIKGYIDIALDDDECSLTLSEELADVMKSSVSGYPIVPGGVTFMKDGVAIQGSNYEYSVQNPPDEVKITVKKVIIKGEPTIIKIL